MVSKPLPDMSPVFLFHMSVIVLMIGPASGELHGFLSLIKVPHQMPIQELRAVIAVKPKQRERQAVFDILDLGKDFCFPLTPDRSLFCPAGGDIHGVYGVDKIPQESLPAMGDGIGLQESWFGLIPLVGLNGDLFSQEGTGFGGGSSPASVFDPGRF
jgi:hypothetical protein